MTSTQTKGGNAVRTWALVAVAVSSAFTIGIAVWLITILSAQDWCARALGAAKYADGRPQLAIEACFSLMGNQVDVLGKALLIVIGVQALSLLVLIVIVIAGGRLSFKASKAGLEADVGRDNGRVAGARRVERAAREERVEIENEVKPIPATIGDDVADIIPDDDQFEENTR